MVIKFASMNFLSVGLCTGTTPLNINICVNSKSRSYVFRVKNKEAG